jgi:ABC-type multidrug transport system fused ATPase/permease subunit
VLQEPFLYSRSIAENIGIALPELDPAKVEKPLVKQLCTIALVNWMKPMTL